MKKTVIEKLNPKIQTGWNCWEWLASKDRLGYGQFCHEGVNFKAHRLVYSMVVGDIPDGLVLDHTCRNHGCVNPSHLDPVTQAENIRRGQTGKINNHHRAKTHCPQGHSYSGDNLYVSPKGDRRCRACR